MYVRLYVRFIKFLSLYFKECQVVYKNCGKTCGCELTDSALVGCNLNNCDGFCTKVSHCPVPQLLQPGRAQWDRTIFPTSCKNNRCRILIPPRVNMKKIEACSPCKTRCFLHTNGSLFECF